MKDGQYLKASEKEKIAKDFERFVKGGFKQSQFTKALYKHLSLHFGFIAHYDINGFYAARFANPQGRVQTFEQIITASQWTFKDENTSGNADLNRAIQKTVIEQLGTVAKNAKAEHAQNLRNRIAGLQSELKDLE